MSIITGANVVRDDSLVVLLDGGNPKSNVGHRSLINWNNWTVGSGGVTGYVQNGLTVENERVVASNPWGNNAVVWEARASGNSEGDGGWNTTSFNIDNTQLYRFSVWVRRTSTTAAGNFYLGLYADGDGPRRMDTGAVEGNAYWDCRTTTGLVQNQWYLVVGHVFPANTTFTGRHPDSGFYITSNGRVGDIDGCNVGSGDVKWSYNSTTSVHRTYLYYSTDNTTRLQFYQPRVDLCDGTQPTVQQLLQNAGNTWYDISGRNNHCLFYDLPATNSGYYTFNGTSNYGTITNNSTLNFSAAQTLQIVMRHSYTSGRRNPWDQAYGGYGTWTHEAGDYITWFFGDSGINSEPYLGVGGATPRSVWNVMATTRDYVNYSWYFNGMATSTSTHSYGTLTTTASNITIGNGYAGYWTGDMAAIIAYTRSLTANEMRQNFNAIRGRYNL